IPTTLRLTPLVLKSLLWFCIGLSANHLSPGSTSLPMVLPTSSSMVSSSGVALAEARNRGLAFSRLTLSPWCCTIHASPVSTIVASSTVLLLASFMRSSNLLPTLLDSTISLWLSTDPSASHLPSATASTTSLPLALLMRWSVAPSRSVVLAEARRIKLASPRPRARTRRTQSLNRRYNRRRRSESNNRRLLGAVAGVVPNGRRPSLLAMLLALLLLPPTLLDLLLAAWLRT
ncbi:hypothetical protein EIP91_006756, partial [Steccherinum ochraceum]